VSRKERKGSSQSPKQPESEAAGGSCSILGEGFSDRFYRPQKAGGSLRWWKGPSGMAPGSLLLLASEKLQHPLILYILLLCKNLENSVCGWGGCIATLLKFSSSGEKSTNNEVSYQQREWGCRGDPPGQSCASSEATSVLHPHTQVWYPRTSFTEVTFGSLPQFPLKKSHTTK